MKLKRNQRVALSALFAAVLLFGFLACEASTGSASPPPYTVTLSALRNQDVYLVKVNKSSGNVSAASTGSVVSSSQASSSQASASQEQLDNAPPPPASERPLMDSPQALLWKPGEALWEAERARDSLNAAALSVSGPLRTFTPATVGDAKSFWVNDKYGGGAVWGSLPATLRAQGPYCNVWVADVDYDSTETINNDKISSAQAVALQAKFDIVYPLETNLLGYEFGGGLPDSDPNYGGRDGDPRVQILVYKNALTGLGGYFWQKDYFSQSALGATLKTNYAEIFYLNSVYLDKLDPSFMYSTLAHEFQHMINFNVKGIQQRLNSETWYDEMLSMLTEDVIDPFIGIQSTNAGHPIQQRMPAFLATYNDYGLEEWVASTAAVYPKNYAFGAYLVRNYGGALLLHKMLANDKVNIDSINAALAEINPDMDFQHALDRYGEALVYSGSGPGVISFNAVTQTIGRQTYTFAGFDIWNMTRNPGPGKGPKSYDGQMAVKGYSVQLQLLATNRSGDFSVTLNRPVNANIDLYVMTRAATP